MAKTTLTFELGGRVDVKRLEVGIIAFRRLILALTDRADVAWVVDDLQPGSATVTLRGESDDPAKVGQIVDRYSEIGKALSEHENVRSEQRATKAINGIKKLAASAAYLRFETEDADYTIYANGRDPSQPAVTSAIGAVTGRVQTLSSRAGLRFNLYDAVHDKAVARYLTEGQEELMREAWGRQARVSGQVSREASTGRPIAVRHILNVEIIEDPAPNSYRLARGVSPWQEGNLLPEDAVRQMRDALYPPDCLLGRRRFSLVCKRVARPNTRP